MALNEDCLLEDQRKVDSLLGSFVEVDRKQQNLQVDRRIHIFESILLLTKCVVPILLATPNHFFLHLHPPLHLSHHLSQLFRRNSLILDQRDV